MTKLQPQNHDQTSASKLWPNFSFNVWSKLQLQNCGQTSASTSRANFSFKIVTKLGLQHLCDFWRLRESSHARITLVKSEQEEGVTDWQGKAMIGLGSDKNWTREWITYQPRIHKCTSDAKLVNYPTRSSLFWPSVLCTDHLRCPATQIAERGRVQ